MHPRKRLIYNLAAALEEESHHELVAIPCEKGTGLAVSDGADIRFVQPDTLSSPEAVRAYIAHWPDGPTGP
jgi:hypothetical protein